MVDFHTHILFNMDDGAKNINVSLKMLEMEKKAGVDYVLSTSHFDFTKDLPDYFLKDREQSFNEIIKKAECENIDIPKIFLASEVRLTYEVSDNKRLREMAVNNSDYILIELPYHGWKSEWIKNEIYSIGAKQGLNVILAHTERYIDGKDSYKKIVGILPVVSAVQFNAESFESRHLRKYMKKIINMGVPVVIGSDCHSDEFRKPCMEIAKYYIEKKFGKDVFETFNQNALDILDILEE